ncbi:uncharacterized protein LOC144887105 [Branchiostoma floridae x Branchiostoma japonicum]
MTGQVRRTGGRLAVCVLFLTAWGFLVPFTGAERTKICNGERKTIGCPRPDFQKLLIVRTTYERDRECELSVCTGEGDCTGCDWISRNNPIRLVYARCGGARGNCTLQPCDYAERDIGKSLSVEHKCVNVPMSLGCYQDDPVNDPLLSGTCTSRPSDPYSIYLTVQECISYCRLQSCRYAGVADRFRCYCGNQVQDAAWRRLPITECTAPCKGEASRFCGGWRDSKGMKVFETSIGACGGDLNANEGTIYSTDFPGPYPLDQNCIWNIQAAPDNVVRISLELLDISAEDSFTIIEERSPRTVITVLNATSMTEYVSISSNVSLQFRAGPRRAQQTDGFILRYEAVGHCGPVEVIDDVTSVSPNHGGNVAIGQQASITCKNGQNVTVRCQKNGTFNMPTPYCIEATVGDEQEVVVWAVPVSIMAAVLLVSVGVAVFCIIKRRRAAEELGTSSHEYDMVDPGTSNDEYEVVCTQDSRLPARSPQAPPTFPRPLGVSGTRSDSDYQALDPRTMCNNEYMSLTTNHTCVDDPDYENTHEYLELF